MRFKRSDGVYLLDEYLQYLDANAKGFPPGAREFALADWHYDFRHSQCPHDSWLEELVIRETASGQRRQTRVLEISARFFGPLHDGYFSIIYKDVSSYSFDFTLVKGNRGHGDWISDEVTMADTTIVHHEIEFSEATLNIYCADFDYRWMPGAIQ